MTSPDTASGDLVPIEVAQRRLDIPASDPLGAYRALSEAYGAESLFLLESLSGPVIDRRASIIGLFPVLTVSVTRGEVRLDGAPQVVARCRAAVRAAGALDDGGTRLRDEDALWALLRAVQGTFACDGPDFGFFGYLGYDVAWSIERLPRRIEAGGLGPDVHLSVHRLALRFDLEGGTTTLVVGESDAFEPLAAGELERVAALAGATEADPTPPPAPRPASVGDSVSRDAYYAGVERALEYIAAGDIYQVQLGHEITVDTPLAPFDAYLRLRDRNPSPYMYLAHLDEAVVLGASPELFVRVEGDVVTSRPIAGTIRRSHDEAEDARLKEQLLSDPKERAEHIMLVDLARNDLSRIARTGTVDVDEYIVPESYSHVTHLVSNVKALLREGCDAYDVIKATFPAGTMTGAPKVRAMEIIEELETTRRGVYAGAVGLVDFAGDLNMALCIRTAVLLDGRYSLRASAGVVADSTAEREWLETLSKLNATYSSITGEELGADYAGR